MYYCKYMYMYIHVHRCFPTLLASQPEAVLVCLYMCRVGILYSPSYDSVCAVFCPLLLPCHLQ